MTNERIERGLQQQHQRESEHECDDIEEKGFGKELPHQLAFCGADDFSDAHFFCSFDRAGGGQINIVHPGDDDDEQGDDE